MSRLHDILHDLTRPETQRQIENSEASYRRGVHQGAEIILDALQAGATYETLVGISNAIGREWRNTRPLDFTPPPTRPLPSTADCTTADLVEAFNNLPEVDRE